MGEPLMMDIGVQVEPLDSIGMRITSALRARFFMEGGFESRSLGRQAANLIRRMPMGGHKLIALSQFEGVAAGDPGNQKAFECLQKLLVSLQKPTHKP